MPVTRKIQKRTRSSSPDLSDKRCVYFIQAVDGGLIKIGISDDVKHRLRGMQSNCPLELRLVATIPKGGASLEYELHETFKVDWVHGEWFKPSLALCNFIRSKAVPWKNATNKARIEKQPLFATNEGKFFLIRCPVYLYQLCEPQQVWTLAKPKS
jgi:hypothetical protein